MLISKVNVSVLHILLINFQCIVQFNDGYLLWCKYFYLFLLRPTNNLFIMNLVKYKEQLENFYKEKNLCIIHCYFFFSSGMWTPARGRGNRIKQLLTSTSNFMLITPSPLSPSHEIDLGYIGVPRSPSPAAST